MKETVNIGVIGLGNRGYNILKYVILPAKKDGVNVIAVCDPLQERVDRALKEIEDAGCPKPFATTDYRQLLASDGLDCVYIATSWETHVEIAVAAMKAGIYTGAEVSGAYQLDDCYKLVHTHEETGTQFMFMENCCYGERELMALNMVRQGIFGDVVHCSGGYCHDLRTEVIHGKEDKHYRLRNYIHRNCDNYPSHEIGPIAKILDINNGNRFTSLTSFASCAKGLHAFAVKDKGPDHPLSHTEFMQGDVITTVIKCAHGQTVTITLETCLPRAYSRKFEVHGTKAVYTGDNDSLYIDGNEEHLKNEWVWKPMWGNAEALAEEYSHPLWAKGNVGQDVHGGIDHLVFAAFIDAVKNGSRPPIDVYDAATYMAITVLSEDSIANGSTPVAFPDFTSGKWTMRTDICDGKYNLDRVDNGQNLYFVNK